MFYISPKIVSWKKQYIFNHLGLTHHMSRMLESFLGNSRTMLDQYRSLIYYIFQYFAYWQELSNDVNQTNNPTLNHCLIHAQTQRIINFWKNLSKIRSKIHANIFWCFENKLSKKCVFDWNNGLDGIEIRRKISLHYPVT